MTDNISTLKDWSQNGKLSEVSFDENGTLQLGDVNIRAKDSVEVTANDKSCQYTAGSIFLQLVDPNQSLLVYRKACKKYQVKDPVKAGDKPVILAFFLGSTTSSTTTAAPSESAAAAAVAVAATSTTTASTTETSTIAAGEASETVNREQERDKEKKKSRSSSDKDKHRSSSSTKKRERSRSSSRPPSSSKEKKTKTIDPEKLFSNLSLVVGRREIKAKRDAEQAKLHLALSTEGFETVAPEIIAKYNNQESMAHEIPVGNSSSILKAGAGKDLSRVLKLYNETITGKNNSNGAGGKNKTGSGGKGGPSSDGSKKSWRPYLVGKKPIIILPKGMQAPVTLVNAHKFFAESKFVSREKMQKELRTIKQAPKTGFTRNVSARLGGGAVEYELMDNPKSKLNAPEDWERVVAVVALGQSWQMKDWPGPYSNPVQLFNRAFGFYIGMEGDKIPLELQSWSVTQSRINRDKRGLDSVAYSSFWNALDEWMAIYKPEMLPQPNE